MESPFAAAAGPQPMWALVPPAARGRYLRRTAQALLDELDLFADVLASEGGIPRSEALLGELLPSVSGLHAIAREGPGALADLRLGRRPLLRAGRRSLLFREPCGVVGIRGGLGSPWAEPVLEAGAALLAGNGVVLSLAVEGFGGRLEDAWRRAGLPEGLLQIVGADADLSAADRVVETEPPRPKGTMLVLEDAPIGRTVGGALWAAFARSGRGPNSVGRAVVVGAAADRLLDGLEAATRSLRVGDPSDPSTEIGPLASESAIARVEELVAEAIAGGATLVTGGRVDQNYYAPAILRSVPSDARLLREPVPGPVLALVEARSEAHAIRLAGEDATSISIWAEDRAHGERVARVLDADVTWVNEHGSAAPAAPVRVGRYVAERQLASQPPALRSARWLPHDPQLLRASEAAARLAHGRESERLRILRGGAIPLARVAVRLAREGLRR